MAESSNEQAVREIPTASGVGENQIKMSWPPENEEQRLRTYKYYARLMDGDHFDAFNVVIDDPEFAKSYQKLKWVQVNFAGLISRICADMLYGEKIHIKYKDQSQQDYADEIIENNNLLTQLYESAITASSLGDAVFKVRTTKNQVIIEELNPSIYFPLHTGASKKGEPDKILIAWKIEIGEQEYVQMEEHEKGQYTNKIYKLEGDELTPVSWASVYPNIPETVETLIDDFLVIHIPNYRNVRSAMGVSDYSDLDSLFFAIDNRMSKIDNILDKHSDPLLLVPPGIIDENGVAKKYKRMIEIKEGEEGKPEYVVWDASLENAFKEVEKLVEFIYMIGEISPDVLGMGKGVSDSGRALKYKLIRTLAKINRKKLYNDAGIKRLMRVAMMLGKEHKITINGIKPPTSYGTPQIIWADGLPNNYDEQVLTEAQAVDAKLTSTKDAIMRIYGYDEDAANEMIKQIESEQPKVDLPRMNIQPATNQA